MVVYLASALFVLTTIIVTIALTDSVVRFKNAWAIARRELAATEADISFEHQTVSNNVVTLRRPARKPLPRAANLSNARRLPSIAGATSAAA